MDLFVEKYRPQDLDGFIGDQTVRNSLVQRGQEKPRWPN